jgi:uncharacterized membrane protein
MTNVLLVGESWEIIRFEIHGRNAMRDSEYDEAADHFIETLEGVGASVTYQPSHLTAESFPRTREEFDNYDLVILSDIGADTLQITEQVADGHTDTDRLAVLADWVHNGGALGMIGGYMSFAGKGGRARYGSTPLADVLPVEIQQGDDRVETPAGAIPQKNGIPNADLPDEWPHILGYNQFVANMDAEVWATVNDDPLLVVGDRGKGSAFAYATDCAPHWASEDLLEWNYLPTLWEHVLERVT